MGEDLLTPFLGFCNHANKPFTHVPFNNPASNLLSDQLWLTGNYAPFFVLSSV